MSTTDEVISPADIDISVGELPATAAASEPAAKAADNTTPVTTSRPISPSMKEWVNVKDAKQSNPAAAKTTPKVPAVDENDKPVCIFKINEEGTEFTFMEEDFKAIMTRAEAISANNVSIISVVGDFRTGKSFVLDFFLRYLRWSEETGKMTPAEDPKLNSIPEWLLHGGEYLSEGNTEAKEGSQKNGFIWRGGKDRTTTGIWMYGKPFARTNPKTGEKTAVILMDTQGMFDFQTSKELTAAIFGLSTLISSYQIYNIAKQIQEDKMQQLHYFLEFSRVALKEFEKATVRSNLRSQLSRGGDVDGKAAALEADPEREQIHPFQVLDYLVRDWQNFEDEDDLKACLSEMPGVLADAFTHTLADEENTREQIKEAFEKINIFLLPHPGTKMTKKKYDGNLSVIEPCFMGLLDVYIRKLFNEEVVTKRMYGKELKPRELFRHVKAFATIFKEGKLPKALTLVQAISVTTNLCAKDDALHLYKQQMESKLSGSSFVSMEILKGYHRDTFKQALEQFNDVATFGDEAHIKTTREKLISDIQTEFGTYVRENDYKLRNGLEKLVLPLIGGILAFVIDKSTDYTCDAWSETCQQLSRLMALVYFTVTLALLYVFYDIYQQQGKAAAGMGAMALGQAAIQKMSDLREEYLWKVPSKDAPVDDIVDELGGHATEEELKQRVASLKSKKQKQQQQQQQQQQEKKVTDSATVDPAKKKKAE